MLQPYSKMDYIGGDFLSNLHPIPHNDKTKTGLDILANVLQIKNFYMSIQSLVSHGL
jgi:hypothetical protein